MPPRKKPLRRKKAAASIGLTVAETKTAHGAELDRLTARVEADGGAVLAAYNEPFGGKLLLLVALPLDKVEPTPYQRDPSDAHVKRLMGVIEAIGSFLDPLIVVPGAAPGEHMYFTPNGNHRLQALKKLGAKAVVALLLSDPNVAFKILALNTEKAHNLREKSLETIRMARARARTSNQLKERARRGRKILKLDEAVSAAVEKLKARGLTSPYLKPFVVSRVNFTRFSKATSFDFDEALDRIIASATKFNVDRVKQEDVAKIGGGTAEAE